MALPIQPALYAAVDVDQSAAVMPGLTQNATNQLYQAMSIAFSQYSEILEMAPHDVDTARKKLQLLEEQWARMGLCGSSALQILIAFHPQIQWECMVPDVFNKFYRFTFHLCKQPMRKHIQADVAIQAWRLLLKHRFRLLDKWCAFIASGKHNVRVINEDQWRQVLEFSRTIHEDLSNYDFNGAWACFLDEFVEHIRSQRQSSKALSNMEEDVITANVSVIHDDSRLAAALPVSPRCGSKRRSPDVDVVVELLSAIPLPSCASDHDLMAVNVATAQAMGSATKRLCTDLLKQSLVSHAQPALQPHCQPALPHMPVQEPVVHMPVGPPQEMSPQKQQPFLLEIPMVQTHSATRRYIKPRRSNVSELVNQTVSGTLFLNE